jgi:hypothetical protein
MQGNPSPLSPAREYERRLELRQSSLTECEKRFRTLGNLRLVVVFVAIAITYLAAARHALSSWWLLAPFAAYVALGFLLDRTTRATDRINRAIEFYRQAVARLENRWAGMGETGERFLDDQHLYGADLDVFGPGSLFELVCTARTRMGEDTLAAWLSRPSDVQTIQSRQGAIDELAPKLDLREDLALLGETAGAGVHPEKLAAWGARPVILEPGSFRWGAYVISCFGAVAAVAVVAYLLGAADFVAIPERTMSLLRLYVAAVAIVVVAVTAKFRKRTHQVIEEVKEASHDLRLLAEVLQRIEGEQFTSTYLRQMRAALDINGESPSARVDKLRKLVDILETRNNQIFGLIAPLLLWDLHCAYSIENWRKTSGPALQRWLEAVGQIEAMSSLAGFRFDRPSYVYPEIVESSRPLVEGIALAHPLLPADGAVANDVHLGGQPDVIIVSGSNMSGKSTLLRTIGINVVLAQAGAPVRAAKLRLTPLTVAASIRVTDSLREGASRFYAEITRLRGIVDAANGQPPVLFLLDEFLHGTNSHDRRIGAEAIVKGLVEKGAIGLLTTHDLALAHIAETLGSRGQNVHFEDHLEDGKMVFDYKMRQGVVQKSNALPLMRSIGLDV